MDLVLELADDALLDALYPATMDRGDTTRQLLSLSVITLLGGYVLYFSGAIFSYVYLFDKSLVHHPRFLKNQVRREITYASKSIPVMMMLIVPWLFAEVRGYSKLYANLDDYTMSYTVVSIVWFLLFTDMLIYWIHRLLHHRSVYAYIHKPHHQWIISTSFASHAFHPVDGFLQGLPYHLYVFFFPIHRGVFLALYTLVNFWTISIHDGLFLSTTTWFNGAAHHTVHHTDFVFNYGQYLTLWDRLAGSYKQPTDVSAEPEKEKDL